MSKYKEIKTEYRNPESLLKALAEIGAVCEHSKNSKENTIGLKTHWQSYGGREQNVAIAIQLEAARAAGIGSYDGVGFLWNGSSYTLIQDESDISHRPATVDKMNKLRQVYAKHEIRRQARIKGYSVMESQDESGIIKMSLVRR